MSVGVELSEHRMPLESITGGIALMLECLIYKRVSKATCDKVVDILN